MATFIMLTRVSPEAVKAPQALEKLEQEAMQHIRTECPDVEWRQSYAVLGPYDYLDIFDAPDVETAAKVATLIRSYGHAQSEIWAATEWARFKQMLHGMPQAA
jgi:uncharacterized protein with GYD domain